jgi:hypothetical protein
MTMTASFTIATTSYYIIIFHSTLARSNVFKKIQNPPTIMKIHKTAHKKRAQFRLSVSIKRANASNKEIS